MISAQAYESYRTSVINAGGTPSSFDTLNGNKKRKLILQNGLKKISKILKDEEIDEAIDDPFLFSQKHIINLNSHLDIEEQMITFEDAKCRLKVVDKTLKNYISMGRLQGDVKSRLITKKSIETLISDRKKRMLERNKSNKIEAVDLRKQLELKDAEYNNMINEILADTENNDMRKSLAILLKIFYELISLQILEDTQPYINALIENNELILSELHGFQDEYLKEVRNGKID